MEVVNYRGYEVALSDRDNEKCNENWKCHHWRCIVYDKPNRKQMGFDVWGAQLADKMKPLEALHMFIDDAITAQQMDCVDDIMNEFGYTNYKEAKKVLDGLKRAYFKCRKFGIDDDTLYEIGNELREKWG